MRGLFAPLRASETADGVRITQRLRVAQRVCYLALFFAADAGGAGYAVAAARRGWPVVLPLAGVGLFQAVLAVLFAASVYHHCEVEVGRGEVVVRKRGRPDARFAADDVLDVAATRCDGDAWPGVRILHAAGFVVVFRGIGDYGERRAAAQVLRDALRKHADVGSAVASDDEDDAAAAADPRASLV